MSNKRRFCKPEGLEVVKESAKAVVEWCERNRELVLSLGPPLHWVASCAIEMADDMLELHKVLDGIKAAVENTKRQ